MLAYELQAAPLLFASEAAVILHALQRWQEQAHICSGSDPSLSRVAGTTHASGWPCLSSILVRCDDLAMRRRAGNGAITGGSAAWWSMRRRG
eukprot:5017224-Pleurochrysis_carterae.AAC.2